MSRLADLTDRTADAARFSGVVRVDRGDDVFAKAYGLADRRHGIPMTVDTRLAIASGSKGLTALAVMSLVEDGMLALSTTARSALSGDLPLIGDDVTIEHLLGHRSGIGDYLDEEAGHDISDYVMPVGVHELATTEQFLAVLGGHPAKFRAGERFAYSNGGYVVLALIAERVCGVSFHELVRRQVCAPATMADTDFLRSDALPGEAGLGYLEVDGAWRTNVFHLPVVGNGDGGIYTTVADVRRFWSALFAGRIVSTATVAEMVRPRSAESSTAKRYGLGFWLAESGDAVILEGYDAGVSFRSVHHPVADVTHTVIANTSGGAWPMTAALEEYVAADLGNPVDLPGLADLADR
jgi:CubicO group peptidase (beta-lactamase class C family)